MKTVWDFVLGIITGVIIALIVKFLLSSFESLRKIIPPKRRKSFDREFKNQKTAEKSILKDAKNSTFMYVFAMKGGSFCEPAPDDNKPGLTSIFNNRDLFNLEQKYLISDLDNPYLEIRANELPDGLPLRKGIETTLLRLEEKTQVNNKIQYRTHKEIVRLRLIIFDHCLYISFQPKSERGRMSPMQRYLKESSGYTALKAYFDDMWEKYKN